MHFPHKHHLIGMPIKRHAKGKCKEACNSPAPEFFEPSTVLSFQPMSSFNDNQPHGKIEKNKSISIKTHLFHLISCLVLPCL